MDMTKSFPYHIKLAVIYAMVWFIDLLDASTLNVSLPEIAHAFLIVPTDAEWAIVGFLLSMTIGISISSWLGDNYGTRTIFLLSQAIYCLSSIGCGLAQDFSFLVLFRIFQGFGGGMAIPIGLTTLMRAMPPSYWSKTTAAMNMVTLIAPALGPVFGANVTSLLGWQWIFLLKLPLSFLCLFLSYYWVKKEPIEHTRAMDWPGFIFGSFALIGIMWVFSEVGKKSSLIIMSVIFLSIVSGLLFLRTERRSQSPLISLSIFQHSQFTFGNLIQSAANTIFLGANFLIAFYLQTGLGFDLISAGWIMSAITPGMLLVQPIVGKFYNRIGPIPFMIPGLILLSLSTYAFIFTTAETSPYLLGVLVFLIGAASSMVQTANVTSIFSCLPPQHKGNGSSLYALFKQISASFGVALTTLILSIGQTSNNPEISIFHCCFIVLGSIPALSLFFCNYISNRTALQQVI